MAINFFEPECTTTTSERVFGIYDKPPAKIEFNNQDSWIAKVVNEDQKKITFTAIDDCLDIPVKEGKRCDAMISYEKTVIFIELKDRERGWLDRAKNQLINTIALFNRDVGLNEYTRRYGYIANRQRPFFWGGKKNLYEQFEKETGFVLQISTEIKLE